MVQAITDRTANSSRPAELGPARQALRTLQALGRELDAQDPTVVRETAAQLVSELVFKPLLAEMREFPFGRELATGGQTESVFGQLLDQRVADTTAASDTGITASIVRHFEEFARRRGGGTATWQTEVQLQEAAERGAQ